MATQDSTKLPEDVTRFLELVRYDEVRHVQAAGAAEVIAEMLFDNCQHKETLTALQVAGLCNALAVISRWQMRKAFEIPEQAAGLLEAQS
ncbi:MAG: hypothetical protein AAGA91_12190 [Pseudomonadota bacterium]